MKLFLPVFCGAVVSAAYMGSPDSVSDRVLALIKRIISEILFVISEIILSGFRITVNLLCAESRFYCKTCFIRCILSIQPFSRARGCPMRNTV